MCNKNNLKHTKNKIIITTIKSSNNITNFELVAYIVPQAVHYNDFSLLIIIVVT